LTGSFFFSLPLFFFSFLWTLRFLYAFVFFFIFSQLNFWLFTKKNLYIISRKGLFPLHKSKYEPFKDTSLLNHMQFEMPLLGHGGMPHLSAYYIPPSQVKIRFSVSLNFHTTNCYQLLTLSMTRSHLIFNSCKYLESHIYHDLPVWYGTLLM